MVRSLRPSGPRARGGEPAGQPALDYLRTAIEHGAHAVSANKGPVVHGYRELSELAAARGAEYRAPGARYASRRIHPDVDDRR
jgi:hypothetical protein